MADQRAAHRVAGPDDVFGQARRDQVRMAAEVHVERRGDDVVGHQRHAVLAQQRRDPAQVRRAEQRVAGNFAETRRQRLPVNQPRSSAAIVVEIVQQSAAVAELLLQFQRVHVGKPQLRRRPAGAALHHRAQRRELRRHAGRRQEHVVFRALVKARELPPQRTARLRGIGAVAAAREKRLRLPGRNDQAGVLPEGLSASAPASVVTTPWMPSRATSARPRRSAVRTNSAHHRRRGAEGNGRQGWPPPSCRASCLHERMDHEPRIAAREPRHAPPAFFLVADHILPARQRHRHGVDGIRNRAAQFLRAPDRVLP